MLNDHWSFFHKLETLNLHIENLTLTLSNLDIDLNSDVAFVLLYNTSKTGMKYDFLPLIFEFVLIEFYRIYRRLF